MKKNVGAIDKYARLIIAAVIAILLIMKTISIATTLGIILAVVAVVFAGTALMGSCPLYSIVGLSTCEVKDK